MNSFNNDMIVHVFIQWLAHKGVLDDWLDGMNRVCMSEDFNNYNSDMVRIENMRDDMSHAMIHVSWDGVDNHKWETLNDEWYELHGRLKDEY